MTGRVLIVGGGPSGLLAALAAEQGGASDIGIYVPGFRRSPIGGVMYLHRDILIPGIEVDTTQVHYQLRGTVEQYRNKVYGGIQDITVSPESLMGVRPAWDLRQVYDHLWQRYRPQMISLEVRADQIPYILQSVDLLVWAAPAHAACRGHQYRVDDEVPMVDHWFRFQQVWGLAEAMHPVAPGVVLCNGEQSPGWYRVANVFGSQTTEWPYNTKPPIPSVQEIAKPLNTNCDCWGKESGFVRAGRPANWRKGVLAHHAYEEVQAWFAKRPRRRLFGR